MFDRIEEIKNYFLKIVGEKTSFGYSADDDQLPVYDFSYNFGALNQILHYESYDAEADIFNNKHSQGFILESNLLVGASEETAKILANLITDVLPENADLQFILWGSDKIGSILKKYNATHSQNGETFSWLAQQRTEYLAQGAYKSLIRDGTFFLRNFRLFISVSVPVLKNQDFTADIVRLRESINSTLSSLNLYTRTIKASDFIGIMQDILHPNNDINPRTGKWNKFETLSKQITHPEYCLHVKKNKLVFENNNDDAWEARVFSVSEYPQQPVLWKMDDSIGQLFNTARQIACPFLFSFSLKLVNDEKSDFKNTLKSYDAKQNAKGASDSLRKLISKKYSDIQYIQECLSEGGRTVQTSTSLILFSRNGEGTSAERKLKDLYQANGWTLSKPFALQFQLLLAALPMRMSEGMMSDLKRLGRIKTMTAFNSANVAPLLGEWKGTETPVLLLPGRRGQLSGFSPFDNKEGNFNVAIAAASGKGKSVFTQDYIKGLLASGGKVWVIDIGRSYEKTCRELGGTFVEFSANNPLCLNPFTFINNFEESQELLKSLLAAMARPTSKVTDEEAVYLEKAIKAAWHSHGCSATISIVARWLGEQDHPVCQGLSHLLYPFTTLGMYGRYFDGVANINLKDKFVVLELQALEEMRVLRRIVMMLLMFQVSQAMYLGDRTQTKSMILEEIWKHFKGKSDGMSDFIEELARTVRRFTGSIVAIAQSINDYFENSTTTAVFDNCDYKIVLGQTEEAIDQLKKNERFAFNPMLERMYKSLRKTDEYSECIIKSPSGSSIHRIILDPYSRILYSSKGVEFDAVKNLQGQGLTLREAISKVAEKFSYEN